jgi:DNA-binding NarL/FixJ family response regulator
MRAILVGAPHDRARLRSQLDRPSIEIVGEFSTLVDARRSERIFDAIIMAETVSRRSGSSDFVSGDESPAEPLTGRETQVLELMAEGLPNKAIARELGISDQTVKFHVSSIAGKLGAANRTDAVRRAVRRGLIAL